VSERVLITGQGLICAVGQDPTAAWETIRAGQSGIAPIRNWDVSESSCRLAGEIQHFDPRELVPDRKIHKLLRRTDFFGLFAGGRAIQDAGLLERRDNLSTADADRFNERAGVVVGSGGTNYCNQYDFLPLLTTANGDLETFGKELEGTVTPMWLLQSLPNNVLCHLGIRYGFKGHNACLTHHSVSGALAIIEAANALSEGDADQIVVVAHDAPIEPAQIVCYRSLGLMSAEIPRPFDRNRDGALLGEGAGGLIMEREDVARKRGARVIAEFLGGGCTSEASGLLAIRSDGDGEERAIKIALDSAGVRADDIGLIVAHGNGTRQSDASESRAIARVFGDQSPPVTAFKWSLGHTLAASGVIESILAIQSLVWGEAPGIATFQQADPENAPIAVSRSAQHLSQQVSQDVALVISRGFGGMNVALLFRALPS
jgi:3-oxoacyl-[acyl-carrier-protein] synthase-1